MIRWALLVALTMLASPVWAAVDGWPALYDVVGVGSDDVLNVRAEPSAEAEIIGTLEYDATGIEVIKSNDQNKWGLVNTGERSGWVSLRFMQRHDGNWYDETPANPPKMGATSRVKYCFGTEPFWSLKFDGFVVDLSGLEAPDAKALVIGRLNATNRTDRFSQVMRFYHKPSQTNFTWITVVRPEQCSDGMSDRAYGIGIDALMVNESETDPSRGRSFVTGCCSIAPP